MLPPIVSRHLISRFTIVSSAAHPSVQRQPNEGLVSAAASLFAAAGKPLARPSGSGNAVEGEE